jgi:hypothetical protein
VTEQVLLFLKLDAFLLASAVEGVGVVLVLAVAVGFGFALGRAYLRRRAAA